MSALPSSYTLVWILGSLRVRGPQTNRPFSVTGGGGGRGRVCVWKVTGVGPATQGRSKSFKQPSGPMTKLLVKWKRSYCQLCCAEAIQSQPLPISKELGILMTDNFTLQQMSRARFNSICEGSKVASWSFASRNSSSYSRMIMQILINMWIMGGW